MKSWKSFLLKSGKEPTYAVLLLVFSTVLEVLVTAVRQEKREKYPAVEEIGKEVGMKNRYVT